MSYPKRYPMVAWRALPYQGKDSNSHGACPPADNCRAKELNRQMPWRPIPATGGRLPLLSLVALAIQHLLALQMLLAQVGFPLLWSCSSSLMLPAQIALSFFGTALFLLMPLMLFSALPSLGPCALHLSQCRSSSVLSLSSAHNTCMDMDCRHQVPGSYPNAAPFACNL